MTESEWLSQHIDNYDWNGLTILFNKTFGTSLTKSGIRRKCERAGIKKSKSSNQERTFRKFKEPIRKWIIENMKNYFDYDDLVNDINSKFGTKFDKTSVKNFVASQNRARSGRSDKCRMKAISLTDEQMRWCKSNSGKYTARRFAIEFNKRFPSNKKNRDFFVDHAGELHLEFALDPRRITNDKLNFVRENGFAKTLTDSELAIMFEERFNEKTNARRISEIRLRNFGKKGMKVINGNAYENLPIGSEKVDQRTGFTFVKVGENEWVDKKRMLYEKYHNIRLTKDDVIEYANGNKDDFSIDNLIRVSRYEHQCLISLGWLGVSEITKAGLEIIRVKKFIKDNHL